MVDVLIVQSVMKQYRVPFFTQLRDELLRSGINLTVAYSTPNEAHASRKDDAELPKAWSYKAPAKWFFGRFVYQSLWNQIAKAQLIIVGPELKYLVNPMLLLMSRIRIKTVAYWGLGPNLHPDRSPLAEWVKSKFFCKIDWWFAYTNSVAEYLVARGMPREKVTIVQNSTDTTELRRLLSEISESERASVKLALTQDGESVVGLYCGMLQQIKAIPFLIEAAKLVRLAVPNFHLVVIGNGPERGWLEEAASDLDWVHYLGSKYGRDSAMYYAIADVFLMGGTAGLGVVDSFAAGLPLLATEMATHPPEISYVVDGENGRLAPHDVNHFARIIAETILNPPLMEHLRSGARRSGGYYTMETMVRNYADGIRACLQHEKSKGRR